MRSAELNARAYHDEGFGFGSLYACDADFDDELLYAKKSMSAPCLISIFGTLTTSMLPS